MAKSHFILLAFYALANSLHFASNGDFIAYYPYMPEWMSAERVYFVWMGVTGIGLTGLVLGLSGRFWISRPLLALYGLCGLDGLFHYSLDLCKDHDLLTNFLIVSEALLGISLFAAVVLGGLGLKKNRLGSKSFSQ
ncbi:MAG: hypothetical protein QE265_05500 [Rhodoferax sp.]|nr:hypothetical protein [Rhodoferax sp.]